MDQVYTGGALSMLHAYRDPKISSIVRHSMYNESRASTDLGFFWRLVLFGMWWGGAVYICTGRTVRWNAVAVVSLLFSVLHSGRCACWMFSFDSVITGWGGCVVVVILATFRLLDVNNSGVYASGLFVLSVELRMLATLR